MRASTAWRSLLLRRLGESKVGNSRPPISFYDQNALGFEVGVDDTRPMRRPEAFARLAEYA